MTTRGCPVLPWERFVCLRCGRKLSDQNCWFKHDLIAGVEAPQHCRSSWCSSLWEETHACIWTLWPGEQLISDFLGAFPLSMCFFWQDLKKYFDSLNGEIDGDMVKSLMFQLLRGLNFCHTHNVLHRLISCVFTLFASQPLQGSETTESSDQ